MASTAGNRQNTKTYLEKLIGEGFTVRSRSYSSNTIIKRTTVVGQGNGYKCGERINSLAARGDMKTDVGVLSDYQVTSGTGQYDTITLVFEELLTKNRYGFSVYTNTRMQSSALPYEGKDYTLSGSSYEQTSEAYKYYWNYGIITPVSDAKTVTSTELTNWQAAGWNTGSSTFDGLSTGLNSTDFETENGGIKLLRNGERMPNNWTWAEIADGDDAGQAIKPLYTDKSFYFPSITILQTIYCEDDSIVGNILDTSGKLFSPRKTDRAVYDTYGIDESNDKWLCEVQSVDTASAISKVTVSFRYKKGGWSTKVYGEIKSTLDAFVDGII